MSIRKIIEWDKRNLDRLRRFQLPNKYKRIGLWIAFLSFGGMLVIKLGDFGFDWVKHLLKNVLLVGLLMISTAREKVEDEMIASVRMQSYAMSFVIGVVYAIIQPYVNYGVDLLLGASDASLDMGYIQVMTFMLIVQILFFYVMLKKCRA